MTASNHMTFEGPLPVIYDQYLVPLIFDFYAADLASRVGTHSPSRVLEVAAGTGAVTRHLSSRLPAETDIIATDSSPAMLERAGTVPTSRPVEWRRADALDLPFDDASFDVVACQFGVMFFPDKSKAFAEARRVLRPGGTFFFSVWDSLETNPFADLVATAVAELFPDDPPSFLGRVPYAYHDPALIARDLQSGGFSAATPIERQPARSIAESPAIPAVAFIQGTPLRKEIESRDPSKLEAAIAAATSRIEREFGPGRVDALMQALLVTATREA